MSDGGGRWTGCFSSCLRHLSGGAHSELRPRAAQFAHSAMGPASPVSVRFTSRSAEWGILLDPELKFGESYMNGTFVVEEGTIADVLAIALGQKSEVSTLGTPASAVALPAPPAEPVQSAPARAPQRCASLRSRRPALLFIPGRRPAIQLRIFRETRSVARRCPAREEAASGCQAAARAEQDGHDLRVLDIGCGWGGLGLYLAEIGGADVTGVTLSEEQHAIANERAAEKSLSEHARVPAAGLSRCHRPVRPHRVGRNVRACRGQSFRHLLPKRARNCSPTTA